MWVNFFLIGELLWAFAKFSNLKFKYMGKRKTKFLEIILHFIVHSWWIDTLFLLIMIKFVSIHLQRPIVYNFPPPMRDLKARANSAQSWHNSGVTISCIWIFFGFLISIPLYEHGRHFRAFSHCNSYNIQNLIRWTYPPIIMGLKSVASSNQRTKGRFSGTDYINLL